ncbi:phage portal protein [Afipia carboxidovorans]|uniref:phage portal protein n=1 Tax=Afipia carboxidovorans TaxID=40137 RepID=UPI0024BF7A12|nr:phage portal protein [Afipia carboxidovorans]
MANVTKPRLRVNTRGAVVGTYVEGELVRPSHQSGYMRGNASPFFFDWNPALRDQRDDVFVSYQQAAARAIDAIHNSGWISGAVEQAVSATVGAGGLRLAARPNPQRLGWDAEKTNNWSEIVEGRWKEWSERPFECDAAGKSSIAQQTENVLRAYFSHGEALALLPFINRAGRRGTKVQLLPPHRLTQDTNLATRMFQGVSIDSYGMPVSYRIRNHKDDFFLASYSPWVDVRARDAAGRPQVIHLFEGREGQMRGITPMAPALQTVRQYDQLSDATLQTALIQAIFAATITSEGPTQQVLEALQSEEEQHTDAPSIGTLLGAQAAWYQNTKIDLGGASRIAHLFPGNKLEFLRSEQPFGAAERHL